MLKVGLIGAGYMGEMHSTCYQALSSLDVKIVAVADLRKDRGKLIADIHGAKIYETGMALIEQADVDMIDICLPTYLHTEHAIAAMKKGRAVFIEKPVCLTLDEGVRLIEAEQKYNAIVMVGQCIRLWDEYAWLKTIVDNNIYGNVVSAVFKRLSPYPKWAWENWLHKPHLSGSVALDMHIHDIDYIRYILGEPIKTSASAARKDGIIQQIFATLEYPASVVLAEVCWDYPETFPFSMSFRVKCEHATITFDSSRPDSLLVHTNAGEILKPELKRQYHIETKSGGNISSLGGYYNELKYFVECIKSNQQPIIAPLNEAIKSVKQCLHEIELVGGALKH